MKDTERAVSFYDLSMESKLRGEAHAHPQGVPVAVALEIAYAAKGSRPYSSGSGSSIKVTLADWKRNPATRDHYLVFNRADASLPDIPLRHIETDLTRMAGKDKREGIDLSCHVLIRENPDPRKPALMLLTNGSALSTNKICSLLGLLFRTAKSNPKHEEHFYRDHPSGVAGKKSALASHFTVSGHQNATLSNLLRGGQLEGVELVTEPAVELDASSALDVTSVQFTLEPVRPGIIGVATIMNAVRKLREKGNEPTKAKVRYKPRGRDKVESHTFDVAALEGAFVRRETIRFLDPIAARYERVEMRVVQPMIDLANREKVG